MAIVSYTWIRFSGEVAEVVYSRLSWLCATCLCRYVQYQGVKMLLLVRDTYVCVRFPREG